MQDPKNQKSQVLPFPPLPLYIASFVLLADQLGKFLIQANLPLWGKKTIIPSFFNLVHILNKGAAFGFLNNSSINWQSYFFIAVTLLAILIILYILMTSSNQSKIFFLGLGFILGGACGNLVDRIRIGMVVDYLDFYIGNYHWPAFNIADAAISTGAAFLIISFYKR